MVGGSLRTTGGWWAVPTLRTSDRLFLPPQHCRDNDCQSSTGYQSKSKLHNPLTRLLVVGKAIVKLGNIIRQLFDVIR